MLQKFRRIFWRTSDREKTILTRIRKILNFLQMDDIWILDDGTGKGLIARGLIKQGHIIGIDQTSSFLIKSKKNNLEKPEFIMAVGEYLPFRPNSFHVIISQMVLEHVFNVKKYLEEIYFVLNEKGIVYLALPNRLYPIEPHTNIPFITYLPHILFQKIVNAKMRKVFPLNCLNYNILKVISKVGFRRVRDLVPLLLKNAEQFYPSVPGFICRFLIRTYRILCFFIPTWIWLFKKN